jgi:methylenetetrahydrofolate dehydrogenase (NADP+) / methenyltetrahydrofolate cyclohydrolase
MTTPTNLIDGKAVADAIVAEVAAASAAHRAATGRAPGLAVVLVGETCGFHNVQHTLPTTTTEADLLALVARLNADPAIDGILVQLPLPAHVDAERVLLAIDPAKDVDGFHPVNVGLLGAGATDKALIPCTPHGSLLLIRRVLGADLSGKEAVVIGRSNIVGKPMAQLLLGANATVTIAHSRSPDLPAIARRADIVVAAVGRPEMVRGSWIKPGATVIDVGINRVPAPEKGEGKTKLVGDVATSECAHARAITPVPGGVGPMTIAMLMANTAIAAARRAGRPAPSFHGEPA